MLTDINPKLPMRDKAITKNYYLKNLSFKELGDYDEYLIVGKDNIELLFLCLRNSIQKKTMAVFISELMLLTTFTNHCLTVKQVFIRMEI